MLKGFRVIRVYRFQVSESGDFVAGESGTWMQSLAKISIVKDFHATINLHGCVLVHCQLSKLFSDHLNCFCVGVP